MLMKQITSETIKSFVLRNNISIPDNFIDIFMRNREINGKLLSSDIVCELLGYRSNDLNRALKKFDEGHDYFSIGKQVKAAAQGCAAGIIEEKKTNKGGSGLNKKNFLITSDCFKMLAMQKNKNIQRYYIKLEEIINQLIEDIYFTEINEKNIQIQEMKQIIQQQNEICSIATKLVGVIYKQSIHDPIKNKTYYYIGEHHKKEEDVIKKNITDENLHKKRTNEHILAIKRAISNSSIAPSEKLIGTIAVDYYVNSQYFNVEQLEIIRTTNDKYINQKQDAYIHRCMLEYKEMCINDKDIKSAVDQITPDIVNEITDKIIEHISNKQEKIVDDTTIEIINQYREKLQKIKIWNGKSNPITVIKKLSKKCDKFAIKTRKGNIIIDINKKN